MADEFMMFLFVLIVVPAMLLISHCHGRTHGRCHQTCVARGYADHDPTWIDAECWCIDATGKRLTREIHTNYPAKPKP